MCGIIGYENHKVTKNDLKILKQVMLESRIRGKHASGVAWFDGKTFQSYIRPVPIDDLLCNFDLSQAIYNEHEIAIIGHARYSTSDIHYNQPIIGNSYAIAHNGVISQVAPEKWKKLFGYNCKTKNDSELLLRALENHDLVFEKFPGASIAAVVLNKSGEVSAFRNEFRPLWQGILGNGIITASTYDILHRAGVRSIKKIKPTNSSLELQRRDMTQWTL